MTVSITLSIEPPPKRFSNFTSKLWKVKSKCKFLICGGTPGVNPAPPPRVTLKTCTLKIKIQCKLKVLLNKYKFATKIVLLVISGAVKREQIHYFTIHRVVTVDVENGYSNYKLNRNFTRMNNGMLAIHLLTAQFHFQCKSDQIS